MAIAILLSASVAHAQTATADDAGEGAVATDQVTDQATGASTGSAVAGDEGLPLPPLPPSSPNAPPPLSEPTPPGLTPPTPSEPAAINPPPTPPRMIPATPALRQPTTPSLAGGFNVRLARAPKMLGDFFGNSFAPLSGQMLVGRAVHHLSTTASGNNEIRIIDESGSQVVYGSQFFSPAIAPPAPSTIEGLTGMVGDGGSADFVAKATGGTTDVYIDVVATTPDLTGAAVYEVYQQIAVDLPAAGPGDLIGRTRLNDNNSAMPEDRIYFDYNFFHNAALTAGGVDVNRFAPGFEKTFLDGMASVEVRVPMGISFSSEQVAGVGPAVSQYEFGNVVIAPKLLLSSDCDLALACGLGVALPTADDINLRMVDGTNVIRVENESVHLLPYLAMLYYPVDSSMFAHGFLTFDFDLNGNTTHANVNGSGLQEIGTWNDQHLVSLNLALGRWLYQSDCPDDRLQGVALSGELHYTASLNDADTVSGGTFVVGNPRADLSVLNGTIGGHVRVGMTTFTAGYTTPLNSDERVFDGELRFFANRAF